MGLDFENLYGSNIFGHTGGRSAHTARLDSTTLPVTDCGHETGWKRNLLGLRSGDVLCRGMCEQ
jgi:hypothetical protein